MVTSSGESLAFLVPQPWTTEAWAKEVDKKVAPFLKRSFPALKTFRILLDGEQLMHGPAAKAMYKKHGITILPCWPKYSPALNPQENVWPWSEKALRKLERPSDSFEKFQTKVLKAVQAYPKTSAKKLIRSIAKRVRKVISLKGGMCGK